MTVGTCCARNGHVLRLLSATSPLPHCPPPASAVFASIGRVVWRDVGPTAICFRLLMKVGGARACFGCCEVPLPPLLLLPPPPLAQVWRLPRRALCTSQSWLLLLLLLIEQLVDCTLVAFATAWLQAAPVDRLFLNCFRLLHRSWWTTT